MIVCICLFAGASCVSAAVIGDAQADNQTSFDCASDVSAVAMDDGHSIEVNHISKNKTHFSHDGKKSDFGIHVNDHDNHIKIHKGHGNDSDNQFKSNSHKSHANGKPMHYPKMAQHDERPNHESQKLGKQTQDIAHKIIVENIMIKTDFANHICVNSVCSSEKMTCHDCKMAGQDNCLCCENEYCSHDVALCNDKVNNIIRDDSTCCYREYHAQFNTTAGILEATGSKSRNSKDQDTLQSEYEGYIIPSNRNLEGEFAIDFENQFYGDLTRFDCSALNIEGGYPQADIEDYNMEYYIFTNPDIIIEKANVNVLPKTIAKTIFNTNHCLHDLDANSNDFNQLDFNIELFAENCITHDNYFPIETTFFYNHESSHQDNLPFFMSDDENGFPLNNFGGIK